MDFIATLGELALGSRLRRLSDTTMKDVKDIYSMAGVDFEPRWFPLYSLLSREGEMGLMDIARCLRVTHPAVHQTAREMTKAGYLTSRQDKKDRRRRILKLTEKGQNLLRDIEPVWDDLRATVRELVSESGYDALGFIETMEHLLESKAFIQRFEEHLKKRQKGAVDVVDYMPKYQDDFKKLNLEWIEGYFKIEPSDVEILNDPEKHILASGGLILFAVDRDSGRALGTVALMYHPGANMWELTKMGVTAQARGRQIGRRLMDALLERAAAMGIETLELFTNSKLIPAVTLYRSSGFEAKPFNQAPGYQRADLRMVCKLMVDS